MTCSKVWAIVNLLRKAGAVPRAVRGANCAVHGVFWGNSMVEVAEGSHAVVGFGGNRDCATGVYVSACAEPDVYSLDGVSALQPAQEGMVLELCDSLSADELVERPGLLARWARIKDTAGDLPGAIMASRIASSLAFGPDLADFRASEIAFQAGAMFRSGYQAAALELLESCTVDQSLTQSALCTIHAVTAQLLVAQGDVARAAAHLDRAGRYADSPQALLSAMATAVLPPSAAPSEPRPIPPIYDIHFFGGLEITASGKPVDVARWRKNKARSLFLSVALEQGRDVAREMIIERLWPKMSATSATNNYYVTWNGLKRLFAGDEAVGAGSAVSSLPMPIANSGLRCNLRTEICHLDVDDFESALVRARAARASGNLELALDAYADLRTIYRGDLLPGDTEQEWLAPYREYFRSQFVDAMGAAARTAIEAGRPQDAGLFIAKGLSYDRCAEALYELAVEASIEAGHRDEGIKAYLRCRSLMAEEYGLDPSRRMHALYERLLEMER